MTSGRALLKRRDIEAAPYLLDDPDLLDGRRVDRRDRNDDRRGPCPEISVPEGLVRGDPAPTAPHGPSPDAEAAVPRLAVLGAATASASSRSSRDDGRCWLCGWEIDLSLPADDPPVGDARPPRAALEGRTRHKGNVWIAHRECNEYRADIGGVTWHGFLVPDRQGPKSRNRGRRIADILMSRRRLAAAA